MPQLLPLPRFYHPPPGILEQLPVTRHGIRGLTPFPFQVTEGSRHPLLHVRNGESGRTVTGICGLLPARAFHDGTVLPHERTLRGRLERQQGLVTRDRGALGKPVLLTVPSLEEVLSACAEPDDAEQVIFYGDDHIYRLHTRQPVSTAAIDLAGPLVIADGHHRAYTHAALGADGLYEFQYVPVVVAGADELTIGTFLRVIDAGDPDPDTLLRSLSKYFTVTAIPAARPVAAAGRWLLSHRDRHFHLERRDGTVTDTDPGWLNAVVLPDVFGITDTRTDPRIQSVDPPVVVGGEVFFDANTRNRVKLLGRPITRDRFFGEVQAGRTLPPKSTRFEPRVPSGLMVWIP